MTTAMVSEPVSDRSPREWPAGEGMRDTPRGRAGEGATRHGAIASAVAALVLSACGQADPEQTATAGQTLIVPPGSSIIIAGAPAANAGPPVPAIAEPPATAAAPPVSIVRPPVSTSRPQVFASGTPAFSGGTPVSAAVAPASPAGAPMPATDIVSLLSNRTVYARYNIDTGSLHAGDPWVEYYQPDGQYYYRDQRKSFVGRWAVQNGKLCFSKESSTVCGAVYRSGDTIYFTQDNPGSGQGTVVGSSTRIAPGDAERLSRGMGQS